MRVRFLRGEPNLTVWVVETDGKLNALFRDKERAFMFTERLGHSEHSWIEHPGDMFKCDDCTVSVSEWIVS
jgi:hypothetical protein